MPNYDDPQPSAAWRATVTEGPRCPVCTKEIARHAIFCHRCWVSLPEIVQLEIQKVRTNRSKKWPKWSDVTGRLRRDRLEKLIAFGCAFLIRSPLERESLLEAAMPMLARQAT